MGLSKEHELTDKRLAAEIERQSHILRTDPRCKVIYKKLKKETE